MGNFYIALFITAGITFFLRALPFLFFTKREMPAWLLRLGESLPSAVMACLIVYCVQDVNFTTGLAGISPLIAVAITALLYLVSKSMFLSMLGATASYMFLLYAFA